MEKISFDLMFNQNLETFGACVVDAHCFHMQRLFALISLLIYSPAHKLGIKGIILVMMSL